MYQACSSGVLRIAVLVNGGDQSALGVRARGLFERLSDSYDVAFLYRRGNRLRSTARFIAGVRSLQPNLVYVLDTALPGAAAALVMRAIGGLRFIVDTGDPGYELAELTRRHSWAVRKFVGIVEKATLERAAAVVVRGTGHKELLEQQGIESPVYLIRDGVNVGDRGSKVAPGLRRELGLEDVLCVGMMGSIRWNRRFEMCYGWDLVEAMSLLGANVPVRALVIGDGDGLPRLEQRARQLGVAERIRFVGAIPYEQLHEYLSVIDVALSTQTNDAVGNSRTTGKLPEYMASGCYVLATDVGEARLLLPREMRIPYQGTKDLSYPGRLAARITELAGLGSEVRRRRSEALVGRARAELDYRFLATQLEEVLRLHLRQENPSSQSERNAPASSRPEESGGASC